MASLHLATAFRAAVVAGLSASLLVSKKKEHQNSTQKQLDQPLRNQVPNGATRAEIEFNTSSRFPVPPGWKGPVFAIRNDYPTTPPKADGSGPKDAAWLDIDFRKEPKAYAEAVLKYCFEGNVETDWVIQKNKVRKWFHAPWLHSSLNGREPLRGLTFERPAPLLELASTQTEALQNVAIGLYNEIGASVFGQIWQDPNQPVWEDHVRFPLGTVSFKLMMTTATDEQVPTMKGSPGFQAIIAKQPIRDMAPSTAKMRNRFPSLVRLIQVDVAVRDDRSPVGWVFGTFMYVYDDEKKNPWERLVPIGLQWGNDPKLTQKEYDAGTRPVETWMNPDAEVIRKDLGGKRPSWGWHGRLNGPADNFMSSCLSCHSMATSSGGKLVPPKAKYDPKTGRWTAQDDKERMKWFQNIPAGTVAEGLGFSADYSLQLQMGVANFEAWKASGGYPSEDAGAVPPGKRISVKARKRQVPDTDEMTGPTMDYTESA